MTSAMRQARFALFAFMAACAIAVSPASAQLNVADNELRTQMNEFAKRIPTNSNRMDTINVSLERLRQENELLRNLLEQVLATVNETSDKAGRRAERLTAINAEIVTALGRIETEQSGDLALLEKIVEGIDAQAYSRALAAYGNEGNTQKALAELNDIVALGGSSIYLPAAMYWIGQIHFEQGSYSQARDSLTRLLARHPNSPREAEALALLVEIAVFTSDPEEDKWRQRLLLLYPGSLEADRIISLFPQAEEIN